MIVKLKELLRSNCPDDLRDKVSHLRTELHDILVTAKVASAHETADEICQYLDEHWLNDTFAGAEICNNTISMCFPLWTCPAIIPCKAAIEWQCAL